MEEYKNIIDILSEENFNKLVIAYIKDKYRATEAWICNGPYDGGRDLVAMCGDKEIRVNIQITVQKNNIEKKIKDDVKKLENALKQGRVKSDKLAFFCNHHISQSKIDENVRDAKINHGVDLDIHDNFRLASIAENYLGMLDVMTSIFKASYNMNLHLDKSQRLLLDYLATSYDASEMKASFIRVFILFRLYHEGAATVLSIFESLKETFGKDLDKTFIEGLVGRLKSKGFIQSIPSTFPKLFAITAEHAEVIRKIEKQSLLDEAVLTNKIRDILSQYLIADHDGTVTTQIVEFLGGNYDIDPYELGKHRNNGLSSEKKRIDNLKSIIKRNSKADDDVLTQILNDIIRVGKEVPIVEKSAASKLLMGLYKSDRIDNFLNRSEKTVIYDTPVLLQRICLFIDDLVSIDDYSFRTIKLMAQIIEESDIQIKQFTTNAYLTETVHHLWEAYRLSRFLELPWISNLGKSKNVFFNYYLFQSENGEYKKFEDFLKDLFGKIPKNEYQFKQIALSRLESILEECGIEVRPFQTFSDFEMTKNEYEKILYSKGMSLKNENAIKNDVNAILEIRELADEIESKQGIPLNFITWDGSFYKYRQALDENEYWNVVAPQRFADNLSIAKFKVNTDAIGNPMLLYLSENIWSQEAMGFLDIINELYKGDRIRGIKLLNIIATIRSRQTQIPENEVPNDKIPIDEFLNLLLEHFKGLKNITEFNALSEALQDDAISDKIVDIIEKNLTGFKTLDGKLKPSIIDSFTTIIEPYKNKKNNKKQEE